jgi:hypothetical protein
VTSGAVGEGGEDGWGGQVVEPIHDPAVETRPEVGDDSVEGKSAGDDTLAARAGRDHLPEFAGGSSMEFATVVGYRTPGGPSSQ